VKYWNNGFFEDQSTENDRYEITDEKWIELLDAQSAGKEIYTKKSGEPALRAHVLTEDEKKDALRNTREIECFAVINRGTLWYDTLTDSESEALKTWYTAWLDVTETKVIPERPAFLK
jgi:hypothetical protein